MSGLRTVVKILSNTIDFEKLFGTPKIARESLKKTIPVNEPDTPLYQLFKNLGRQQRKEMQEMGISEDLDDFMDYLNVDEMDTLVKVLKNPNLDDVTRNNIIDNLLRAKREEVIGRMYDNKPNLPRSLEVDIYDPRVPSPKPANDPTFTIVK